ISPAIVSTSMTAVTTPTCRRVRGATHSPSRIAWRALVGAGAGAKVAVGAGASGRRGACVGPRAGVRGGGWVGGRGGVGGGVWAVRLACWLGWLAGFGLYRRRWWRQYRSG